MPSKKHSTTSSEKNISINGDVRDSTVIIGDNNTVNQTIIQKFFNIFKSDSETLEQRNRRILLGHVENAWIKGVLDASLHGAALLDLGIKQVPEAVTKYPWAIKKESTNETLPRGISMLEIFDTIGMGRSLLILGAPGSGKTTMLLELARQLIAHAREDVTYPIPIVFNLSSWTESKTIADWLAQELNNLYSVPRKTAPDWVKGNKLLLLLDGLDEVRQESRAKCVEAINVFRKEHGLISLAVCSRSQDYADLNTKLSFEGAIEVQPLTQKQITEFFNRFGKEMAGIKQVLKKDSALREMAETPLFLSIMILAYRDKQDVDILAPQSEKAQRKHLFDTYIERMFERPRSKNVTFKKQDTLNWISSLAIGMTEHNQIPYILERMQPEWSEPKQLYRNIIGFICGFIGVLTGILLGGLDSGPFPIPAILAMAYAYVVLGVYYFNDKKGIQTVDLLTWNLKKGRNRLIVGFIGGLLFGIILGISKGKVAGLFGLLTGSTTIWLILGLRVQQLDQAIYPGQRLLLSLKNSLFAFLIFGLSVGLPIGLISWVFGGLDVVGPVSDLINIFNDKLSSGLINGLTGGLFILLSIGSLSGLYYGGFAVIQHYTLRFILTRNNLLPWRLIPFLDHCVDLIFLRRVGGGYIFVHRLLMEHFAEMYVETPTSKGN